MGKEAVRPKVRELIQLETKTAGRREKVRLGTMVGYSKILRRKFKASLGLISVK